MALIATTLVVPPYARGQSRPPPEKASAGLCIALEVYVDGDEPDAADVVDAVREFAASRKGIGVKIYDLTTSEAGVKRLRQLSDHFKVPPATPAIYGCGQLLTPDADARALERQLRQLTRLTVFVRSGCPRCARARQYLPTVQAKFPGYEVVLRDLVTQPAANQELQEVVRKHRTAAASVPVFYACNQVLVGWDDAASSARRLEAMLGKWTFDCRKYGTAREGKQSAARLPGLEQFCGPCESGLALTLVSLRQPLLAVQAEAYEDEEPALPLPGDEEALPLPDDGDASYADAADDEIHLPLWGPIRVMDIGLPLFTVAVGLVDGFNPCAMWVLLFLLSVLVNVKSRWKILAVAGTFVFISGAAYFAFMAMWLNVFLWVGYQDWLRLALATLAIFMGVVHVKDFFAFKKGMSLSIPESAKPGIYDRVRRVVTAENIAGAMIGVTVLAVLVNMLELLCTAGLPALYTGILVSYDLPSWQYYAYLLLYNLAYMFDDGLMVGLVVVTMQRRKMQEVHGRYLKLVSGGVILLLGMVMLLRPQWLGMDSPGEQDLAGGDEYTLRVLQESEDASHHGSGNAFGAAGHAFDRHRLPVLALRLHGDAPLLLRQAD